METPPADARAVLEHAFGGEVAAVAGIGAGALEEPSSRVAVPGRVGQLRPFLEVDDEVDGDARLARPIRVGRLSPVADKITGHVLLSSGGFGRFFGSSRGLGGTTGDP